MQTPRNIRGILQRGKTRAILQRIIKYFYGLGERNQHAILKIQTNLNIAFYCIFIFVALIIVVGVFKVLKVQ